LTYDFLVDFIIFGDQNQFTLLQGFLTRKRINLFHDFCRFNLVLFKLSPPGSNCHCMEKSLSIKYIPVKRYNSSVLYTSTMTPTASDDHEPKPIICFRLSPGTKYTPQFIDWGLPVSCIDHQQPLTWRKRSDLLTCSRQI